MISVRKEGGINYIFFDGRIDTTKVMLKLNNSDKQFPSIIRQEHYSVCRPTCSKPDGRYLYHFTPEKCPKSVKPAEIIANNLVSFMKYKGIDKTLQIIKGDSTNVNMNWEGSTMRWVEAKLKRKLLASLCPAYKRITPASLDCDIRWTELVKQQVCR